jgi:hypothetical protein
MTRKSLLSIAWALMMVFGVVSRSHAATLTLEWDPSPGATGYVINWGTTSGSYPNTVNVGNTTSHRFSSLAPGASYFFTITAFNGAGSSPATPEVKGTAKATDLNHDDHPDVLWQNQVTGQLGIWFMNGTEQLSAAMFTPSGWSDPAWKVVAFADFDKDGTPDVLWRHQGTGQLAVWLMNGTTRRSTVMLTNTVSDLSWKIVAVADFNLDGYPDLLWRSDRNGDFGVWFMQGTSLLAKSMLNPAGFADTSWKVVGVADFDQDGQPDLLWRNDFTGTFGVWFMNGTNLRGAAMLDPTGVADLAWKVVAIADFDGDGHPDLLWRTDRTGDFGVWYMGGSLGVTLRGTAMFNPTGIADLNWIISAIR